MDKFPAHESLTKTPKSIFMNELVTEFDQLSTKLDAATRVLENVKQFFPMEVVQGDCAQRYNPNARQMLNSSDAWLVPSKICERSAHKLRILAATVSSQVADALKLINESGEK